MKPILTLLLLALAAVAQADPGVGTKMPALGTLLPGASLPKTTGQVVLVDFWASWCAPCKASFATLGRLQQKYASRGLVVLGIGVDDEASAYQMFAKKQKASFSLVHDSQHTAAAWFNVPTMPSSYLVDRKGVIRHVHRGFDGPRTEAAYIAEIESLLAE